MTSIGRGRARPPRALARLPGRPRLCTIWASPQITISTTSREITRRASKPAIDTCASAFAAAAISTDVGGGTGSSVSSVAGRLAVGHDDVEDAHAEFLVEDDHLAPGQEVVVDEHVDGAAGGAV